MIKRFATIALISMTLPLGGCSSGDDDDGAPTDDTSPWAGKKYLLNMQGEWTKPRGIGRDIDDFVPAFMLAVSGTSADALTMTIGAAQSDATVATAVQNLCGPTYTASFSGSDYPKSQINPATMRVHIKNTPSSGETVQATGNVYGFSLTDVLPPVGGTATTGKFKATMDFRELYKLFTALGPTVSPDGVCEGLYDQYTPAGCEENPECWVKCEACPDGEPYCLTVEAEDISAQEAPDFNIVDVSENTRPATCVDPP